MMAAPPERRTLADRLRLQEDAVLDRWIVVQDCLADVRRAVAALHAAEALLAADRAQLERLVDEATADE
jgi:hypothetical protein